MKSIKFSSVLFLFSIMLFACKSKPQAKQSLHASSKDYFEIKDGSTYTFTDVNDTNVEIVYTSSGFFNNQSNPDIENAEVMGYNLTSPGKNMLTVRTESGSQFKDRIALITNRNDTNFAGPIIFNITGKFSTIQGTLDSVYQYPTYTINGKAFDNVIKVVMKQNIIYKEIYYAKFIGLIAKKENDGKFLYVKKYKVNK